MRSFRAFSAEGTENRKRSRFSYLSYISQNKVIHKSFTKVLMLPGVTNFPSSKQNSLKMSLSSRKVQL